MKPLWNICEILINSPYQLLQDFHQMLHINCWKDFWTINVAHRWCLPLLRGWSRSVWRSPCGLWPRRRFFDDGLGHVFWFEGYIIYTSNTVDGSEIRKSPVEGIGSWDPICLQGFGTSQVVVWDFWTINRYVIDIYPSFAERWIRTVLTVIPFDIRHSWLQVLE